MHAYNLCTQETEAGVFQVQSQPGLHSENLSQNKQTNNNIYAYIYIYIYIYIQYLIYIARHLWLNSVILVTPEAEIRGSQFKASPSK
jgi:hypothetical protein